MQINQTLELVVGPQQEKCRVDCYVANNSDLSRTLLSDGAATIFIDDRIVKKSTIVHEGQKIRVNYIEFFFEDIIPQDIPLNVLYEDSDILVIDKAQGMVVHPALGNYEGTLVNALSYRYGKDFVENMTIEGDLTRPGIVHRLDKETSGVMVVALNPLSHRSLSEQFSSHTTKKNYIAIVKGNFQKAHAEIETNMGRDPNDRKRFAVTSVGRYAHTVYDVIKQYPGYAYVSVGILTGRTHQIRVHMEHLNHPILGDPLYSKPDKKFPDVTMMLHARSLELNHPTTGERLKFSSEVPQRFKEVLSVLESSL